MIQLHYNVSVFARFLFITQSFHLNMDGGLNYKAILLFVVVIH